MGFYDAEQGQASYLKMLADRFTLSDNFHQSFLGGTGANHFMFGAGDAGFWSDSNGKPYPATDVADRQSQPQSRHNQYLHCRQRLHQLLRHQLAGCPTDCPIHREPALHRPTELRGKSLLHVGQYQPGLFPERHGRPCGSERAAPFPSQDHRGRAQTNGTSRGPISEGPITMRSSYQTRLSQQTRLTRTSSRLPWRIPRTRSASRTARSAIRSSMPIRSWVIQRNATHTSKTLPT